MNYWLIKSEPETWSWQQQLKKGVKGELWDGVRNYQAANFMKAMKKGDLAFFYHSGKEKAIVGITEIIKESQPDPSDESGRFVAVTVKAKTALDKAVTLSAIKTEPTLSELLLLRQSRLSVMPIPKSAWNRILQMGKA